jgi:hypothetical protein
VDEEGSPTLPDHPADSARRAVILDALRVQAGREDCVRDAILRWEARLRLGEAATLLRQPALSAGAPLQSEQREVDLYLGRTGLTGEHNGPDEVLAAHGEALNRTQELWRTPAFLSEVVALLRDEVGFPALVAERLAPLMLCEYVEWADHGPPIHVTFDAPSEGALARGLVQVVDRVTGTPIGPVQGTVGHSPLPPCAYSTTTCPLQPPGSGATFIRPVDPTPGRKKRGPRKDAGYLRERARWYFEVEVLAPRFADPGTTSLVPPPSPEHEQRIEALARPFLECCDPAPAPRPGRARWANPFALSRIAEELHAARAIHGPTQRSGVFADDCGCKGRVSKGIREVKRLLGLI